MPDTNDEDLSPRQLERIQLIEKHFPGAITKDPETGKRIINANKIQNFIDPSYERPGTDETSYELQWIGKRAAYESAETQHYKLLKPLPQADESKNFDETGNILIKGDNLDALKILHEAYFGKVKVIYIDPPYNTTSEKFIYNDDFTDDDDSLMEKMGYSTEEKDIIKNIYGSKTHSGWLSFMLPRLLLARDLLKEDGVIFISIDEHEESNLKILCDEIFGEENFITKLVWRKKYGGGKGSNFFVDLHEYVLVYGKFSNCLEKFIIERSESSKETFNETDQHVEERGKFYTRPLKSGLEERKTLIYPIECPDGSEITTQWICSEETFKKLKKEDRIVFKKLKNGKYNVYKKFYEKDNDGKVLTDSIIYDLAYNQNGKEEIKFLFDITEGRDIIFNNPKPTKLVSHLIKLLDNNTNGQQDIILDFFSGSGTTADAVMQLNAEDSNNRKFILVQIAEEISQDNKSALNFLESIKKPANIFEICAERIRRAGEKIIKENPDAKIDTGFKIFEVIDNPNRENMQKKFEDTQQDQIKLSAALDDDVALYNLMLEDGKTIDEKPAEIIDGVLYVVGDTAYILKDTHDRKKIVDKLKDHTEIKNVTMYSPGIKNSEFSLQIEDLLIKELKIKKDNIKVRL